MRADWGAPPIVHGELTPESIVVGVDGASSVRGFATVPRARQNYASPEHLALGLVDRRSDIWSASAILWEMLTGQRPFVSPVARDAAMPRPSSAHPAVADAIDGVVLHGLARDPAKRFGTARQMSIALALYGTLAQADDVGAWVSDLAEGPLRAQSEAVAGLIRVSGPFPQVDDEDRTTAPLPSVEDDHPIARRPNGAKKGRFVMGM
jgi:serine/threonine-protein kinase